MKNLINGIHLQFFAEDDVESYNDVDFGVAFADDSESSVESETQEPSTETQGEENVELANQQTEEVEIPNEVWKKARLKAEREADAKIKKMQEQFNNSFADDEYLGKINPYTNKAIRTKQDQQEYLETYSKDTLKQNGLDENIIQQMIDNNPVIQEAKALKAQMQQERGQSQLQKELEKVSELNPEVKTIEDFAKLSNFEEMDNLIRNRGFSLSEAYIQANYKELVGKQTAIAKQQAINAVKGKSHLTSTEGTAGEEIVVPKDTIEMYKALNPEMSLSEIKEDYAKRQKAKGRK